MLGKSEMPSYCRVTSTVVIGPCNGARSEFVGVAPLKVIPNSDRPANLERMPPLGRFGFANSMKCTVLLSGWVSKYVFSRLATELLCE